MEDLRRSLLLLRTVDIVLFLSVAALWREAVVEEGNVRRRESWVDQAFGQTKISVLRMLIMNLDMQKLGYGGNSSSL